MAIAHDFRIMQDAPKRKICLSELKIGGPLASSYCALCLATLPIQTFRKIVYAESYTPTEALADGVVQELYIGDEEAEKKIKAFAE